ncbi:excinuclease ABC subunit UvrB [Patescibacteria group bacterium]|nr:excinuclease ABC subunit UvrB [Patescibacteria group bacterium]
MDFKLISKFQATGDQPKAIKELLNNLGKRVKNQVLLGVTGSGKTFTVASVIEKIQKPALIISHNKTLCAQLYQEFKDFFPNNAVHYFVSYYDYYQPEAYIPQSNTYIEKDSKVNEEIDRLRHSAVQDLVLKKDTIICASVSCIYNLGDPADYRMVSFKIRAGQKISRRDFISKLTDLQYQRNDMDLKPGTFRARAEIVEICLIAGKETLKVSFSNNGVDTISLNSKRVVSYELFPSHFWVTPQEKLQLAVLDIKKELDERISFFKKQGKLIEAQRIEEKTNYDLEMLRETGYCHGIENYSRHMEFREPGKAPYTLIDYFQHFHRDFLVFVDESHMTLPQIKAMAIQDKARKQTLIDFGFRLPSAIDNRPLTFKEFEGRQRQSIYVSATPGEYERRFKIVEQLVRPTGLLEPPIEIRPSKEQIKDLIKEIKNNDGRVLILTLTKRLSEAVAEYLSEQGIKTQYLHSEIKTLERPQILNDFRAGKYDVLVGINLLREGLDLPEVSLVAILDADKEGFLRDRTTLIQTMGRAARHIKGRVILYADKTTTSMESAIREIERRRKIQEEYNKKHNVIPEQIKKDIRGWGFKKSIESELWIVKDRKILEGEMQKAAQDLNFERAAEIRDLIKKLK